MVRSSPSVDYIYLGFYSDYKGITIVAKDNSVVTRAISKVTVKTISIVTWGLYHRHKIYGGS